MSYFACCLLLLFAGFGTHEVHAQITITGHELPLLYGLSQDITCTASGIQVATIQWLLQVAGFYAPIVSDNGVNELVFQLEPTRDGADLDGSVFKCVVTTTDGTRHEESITVRVKEMEHSLNVTASSSGAVLAGSTLTLTCTAVIDRVPHLKWIGPDGPVTSGNGIIVSGQVDGVTTSVITLTFNSIRTSHAGCYNCSCETREPPSIVQTVHWVEVEIPPPDVRIERDPDVSTQLFTTDTLVLTCIVQVHSAVDTPIAVNAFWSGNPALSDSPRVTLNPIPTVYSYASQVTFNSLKSSDTAGYMCSVRVVSNKEKVMNSDQVHTNSTIEISLRVTIDIEYDPPCDYTYTTPPYYRPASNVTLTCNAYNAAGSVSYEWSSTCSSCFVDNTSHTISEDILTCADAGSHTCSAIDGDGNTGSATSQMIIKGVGIYIVDSKHISNSAVPNNTIIVPKSTNRRLDFYCYSEACSGTAYIQFPNGNKVDSSARYNDVVVEQVSGTAGVHAYTYKTYSPQLYGVYTCEVPDSTGALLHFSTVIYYTLPGPPRVYSSEYNDLVDDQTTDAFMTITCSTSDSPPTKVIWACDEDNITTSDGFETMQVVTNRRNVYYDNILIVKNATKAAGIHDYKCIVSNSQGSNTHTITTNIPVFKRTEITSSGPNIDGKGVRLTGTVELRGKLNKHLLQYMKLEWLGPQGVSMTTSNGITIGTLALSSERTTLDLFFDPLSTDHGGLYRCIVSISIPSLTTYFQKELRYQMTVISRSFFQLKFGPVCHCSKWHEDRNFASHLESDIKTALVAAINERCRCNFQSTSIDLGEFSCQTIKNEAIYRARITGTVFTSSQLLELIEDWKSSDGTFLNTYNGRFRLRIDPDCPLAIGSFSEAECGPSVNAAVLPDTHGPDEPVQ